MSLETDILAYVHEINSGGKMPTAYDLQTLSVNTIYRSFDISISTDKLLESGELGCTLNTLYIFVTKLGQQRLGVGGGDQMRHLVPVSGVRNGSQNDTR